MTVGVYALRHGKRRLVYVGASRDLETRCRMWSSCLSRVERALPGYGVSKRLFQRMRGTRRGEWEFVILEELANDVLASSLRKRERWYIRLAVSRFGEGCLNVSDRTEPLRLVRRSWADL